MSREDIYDTNISEDNNELLSGFSNISKAGNLNFGCDFQNLLPHRFEPEKQDQVISLGYYHSPDKAENRSQSESLHHHVGNKEWCQCGKSYPGNW